MFICTAEAAAMPPPDSETACIMIAASVIPRPAPPDSDGIAMPSQPAPASAAWKSCGKPPSRSFLSQYSSPKSVQICSIAARMACCSSLNEKSTMVFLASFALREPMRASHASVRSRERPHRFIARERFDLVARVTEIAKDSQRMLAEHWRRQSEWVAFAVEANRLAHGFD